MRNHSRQLSHRNISKRRGKPIERQWTSCGFEPLEPRILLTTAVNLSLGVDTSALTWQAFLTIDDSSSETAGLAGISFDVMGTGGVAVSSSTNGLPTPTETLDSQTFFQKGFKILRSNGVNGVGITGAQDTISNILSPAGTGNDAIVEGLGEMNVTVTNGNLPSTIIGFPLLIGSGSYSLDGSGNLLISGSLDSTTLLPAVVPQGRGFSTHSPNAVTGQSVFIESLVLPVVGIEASDESAAEENGGLGVFTITRTGSTAIPLTVNYSVTEGDGQATNGGDYNLTAALSGTLEIPIDQASATITITPADDDEVEGQETVNLVLGIGDYEIDTFSDQATVTLSDNDLPLVNIIATDDAAAEVESDGGTFRISRTGTAGVSLTVSYSLAAGVFSAANGVDYNSGSPLSGIVEIPAGQTSADILIDPVDDENVEGDETVVITVEAGAGYVVDTGNSMATVNLTDNDTNPPGDNGNIKVVISGGSLRLTGDAMDNHVTIDQRGLAADQFRITPNNGTMVNGVAVPIILSQVTRSIGIRMGEGNDSVVINDVDVAKDITIDGGNGDNMVDIDPATIGRNLSIRNREGRDKVTLQDVTVRRSVTVRNGNGGSDFIGMSLNIENDLILRNRNGIDTLSISWSTIDRNMVVDNGEGGSSALLEMVETGRDMSFRSRGGNDAIAIHEAVALRNFRIDNGSGDSAVSIFQLSGVDDFRIRNRVGDDSVVASFVTTARNMKIDNGAGASAVDLRHIDASNDIAIRSRDGNEDITISNVNAGRNVRIDSGNGDSNVNLTSSTANGDVTIRSRNGLDAVSIAALGSVRDLRVENGKGGSSTNIDTSTISRDLRVRNQDGIDSFILINSSVGRDVSVDHGKGGSTTAFAPIMIGRNLTTRGASGNDSIDLDVVTVLGRITVSTGAGDDSIAVNDSTVSGALSIRTGRGNDTLDLDSSGAVSGPPSTFSGRVDVNMGHDDDIVIVGVDGEAGNSADIDGRVSFDGSRGNDTLDLLLTGNLIDALPRIRGFEIEV